MNKDEQYYIDIIEKLKLEKHQLQNDNNQLHNEKLELQNDLNTKNDIIKQLEQSLLNSKRRLFGKASEKVDLNQLSLFNDVEEEVKLASEPRQKSINNKKLKKLNVQVKENVDEIKEYKLDDIKCDCCTSEMRLFKYDSSYTIEYVPAKVKVVEHKVANYVCDKCNDDKSVILKASAPNKVIHKSVASPSLIANIIDEKYVNHMPLYRIETKYKSEIGFDISRQTMSSWLSKVDTDYFNFIYKKLYDNLLKSDIIHADETRVAVVRNKDSKTKKTKDGFMWVYASGKTQDNQIVLYEYQPNRQYSHAKVFLKGYNGYLQADGYDAYKGIANTKLVGCFAHVRRKFFPTLQAISKEHQASSKEAKAIAYCDRLFELDKCLDSNVLELKRKTLIEFKEFLDNVGLVVNPKLLLGKAIAYAQNQWKYLEAILEDARLEVSNNRAERAIRPFTIGRKNWMFYFSENGAKTGARIYSIVETCKLNKVHVSKYFEYILEKMMDPEFDKNNIDELLPTSKKLPTDLYLD